MTKNHKNTLKIGEVLNDKWVVLEFIARGGMGEVYRAHQLNLKRDVAIKIISREWLESLEDNEEGLQSGLQRFRNEVEAMAQVRHPNVLHIFDYGSVNVREADSTVVHEYIAMEFIPGSTLRSTMSEEGFYPEEDLIREWLEEYFLPMLDGVEALHNAGIIHRDLKPENILLDGKVPKIADFGLARLKGLRPVSMSVDMMGTPAYMSPEQFLDFKRTDQRSDIYALGKMLYEAIVGRITDKKIPFKSSSLENPATPFFKMLDRLIQSSTAEMKASRPRTIEDFRKSLLEAVLISHGESMGHEDNQSHDNDQSGAGPVASGRMIFQNRWVWIGAAFLVSVILIFSLYFRHRDRGVTGSPVRATGPSIVNKKSDRIESPRPDRDDGVSMHLIPGGVLFLPEGWGSQARAEEKIEPFYMDETPVTNHQYVDFLNQMLSRITVKGGVVRDGNEIWLLLGEVLEGYEPIVFKGGRFRINKPGHSSCPVVRVTAYGSAAYARFFGKRLPSAMEWLYALDRGGDMGSRPARASPGQKANQGMGGMMGGMMDPEEWEMADERAAGPLGGEPLHFPAPVILSPPDRLGIRGLDGNVSEWTVLQVPDKGTAQGYVIMGGFRDDGDGNHALPRPLPRHPWEAFEEVGFRCVKNATPDGAGS